MVLPLPEASPLPDKELILLLFLLFFFFLLLLLLFFFLLLPPFLLLLWQAGSKLASLGSQSCPKLQL